jgi:hypothetical protein
MPWTTSFRMFASSLAARAHRSTRSAFATTVRPDAAKAILKDAFDRRRAICIFESGSSAKLLTAGMMVGVPVAVLALMPFARPFRWAYLLFTYLIPLVPLILLWDGMVSILRIYSPEQMKKLTEDLQAPDYAWEIGRIQLRAIPRVGLPYLIGRPQSKMTLTAVEFQRRGSHPEPGWACRSGSNGPGCASEGQRTD